MSEAKIIVFPCGKQRPSGPDQADESMSQQLENQHDIVNTVQGPYWPELPSLIEDRISTFVETTFRSIEHAKCRLANDQHKLLANRAFNDDLGALIEAIYDQSDQALCASGDAEDILLDASLYMRRMADNLLSGGDSIENVLGHIEKFIQAFGRWDHIVTPIRASLEDYR